MKATDISYDLLMRSGLLKILFEFLKVLDNQLCDTLERSSFAQLY